MIVEGYALDVYCDGVGCDNSACFGGITKGVASKEARRAGWLLRKKEGKAYCRDCKKKKARQ